MLRSAILAAAVFVVSFHAAHGKDKKKQTLPADILQARTVLVIVDPNAGVDVTDPNANRLARVSVQQALDKWGRFNLVQEGYTADLVIVLRKGNGKTVQPTIAGTPANGNPPGSVSSDGNVTRASGRWGTTPFPNDPSNAGTQPANPYPRIEAGPSEDTFVVYRGNKEDPNASALDAPAVWRYSAKDALQSPSVPAVEAFHKAIDDAEKQYAKNP
jgi:hypothetical protein